MSLRQFTMDLAGLESDSVESALEALGAQAITYTDAADTPVLEPVRGETPLWPSTRVSALFPPELDTARLTAALRRALGLDALPPWEVETLEDRAWEREWLRDFHAMRFGRRLWVCPTGATVDGKNAVVVRLDPGLAFGTGTHPTTAMCLEWLDGAALRGYRVLDYGCGSGILAIAALRLGAASAVATDIDPQALAATRSNACRNSVDGDLAVVEPSALGDSVFDLVVANILAGPLVELAGRLAELTRAGGELVLSGILSGQAGEVLAACEPWFAASVLQGREDWILIGGRRREE